MNEASSCSIEINQIIPTTDDNVRRIFNTNNEDFILVLRLSKQFQPRIKMYVVYLILTMKILFEIYINNKTINYS